MAYPNNFLKNVAFQLKFSSVENLKDTLHESIINFCKDSLDVELELMKITGTNIINFSGTAKSTGVLFNAYSFKNENYRIIIDHSQLRVMNFKYTNHKDFHDLINNVMQLLKQVYKIIVNHCSLRYVNIINFQNGSTFDFEEFINDSLVSPTLNFSHFALARSIGSMVINNENGVTTNFNYGFFNPQFPNKISKREFILDYDSVTVINTEDNILQVLERISDTTNILFEHSIKPGLKAILNQQQ